MKLLGADEQKVLRKKSSTLIKKSNSSLLYSKDDMIGEIGSEAVYHFWLVRGCYGRYRLCPKKSKQYCSVRWISVDLILHPLNFLYIE